MNMNMHISSLYAYLLWLTQGTVTLVDANKATNFL